MNFITRVKLFNQLIADDAMFRFGGVTYLDIACDNLYTQDVSVVSTLISERSHFLVASYAQYFTDHCTYQPEGNLPIEKLPTYIVFNCKNMLYNLKLIVCFQCPVITMNMITHVYHYALLLVHHRCSYIEQVYYTNYWWLSGIVN